MKKKCNCRSRTSMRIAGKFFLTMRLTLLLLLLGVFQLSASVYSQNTKLSLDLKNRTVKDVLQAIEEQSEFRFFYNEQFVDLTRKVSVDIEDENVETILSKVFDGANISFKVMENKLIVITPSQELQTQNITVNGKVSDSSGLPLPGVTVVVKGTTQGTITDFDGVYSLSDVPSDATILYSFVGMKSQEISVVGKSSINIVMQEDAIGIEEVVAIGYGTRSKRDVTTAISSITSESIGKSISMTAETAMQGRMTGVQIAGTNGNPMSRPTIRIRGVNTWGISSPLYIIDGIPVTEFGAGIEGQEDARASDVRGPLNIMTMIDPNDIESISVLKDASAAAIYGVRAANGVILITTKKGRGDRPTVEFSSRFGIQNINTSKMHVLNTEQYTKYLRDVYATDPTVTIAPENIGVFDPASDKYLGNSPTYNWFDAFKNKNAPTQDYSIRISGASAKTDYYASGNYANTEGPLMSNNLERYSGAFKLNSEINKWIKIGVNYRVSSVGGTEKTWRYNLWDAALYPAWQPIYDPNGSSGYAPVVAGVGEDGLYSSVKLYGLGTRINVPGELANNDLKYESTRNMGNAYIQIEPVKHLTIKAQISKDSYTNELYSFSKNSSSVFDYTQGDPRSKGGGQSVGTYRERRVINNNIVKEVTINYTNSFGDHNLDVLLNGMNQQYDSKSIGASTDYMTTTLPYLRKLGGENEYTSVESDLNRWALEGLLGRIGYNYKYKYYLDLTLRRDGSARFAPENRWGNFPSVSTAWRLKRESFMENIYWLDDLKLRVGWGQLGNQEVRNLAYLSPINTKPTFAWGNDPANIGYGYFSTAATVFALANAGLQWEKTSSTNIGFDAILFKNMTMTFEYYNKLTDGILQEVSLPNSAGVTQQPVDNVASVRNSGFELSLSYSNNVGDLTYSISGNLTTVKNEVESTYKDIPLLDRGIEEGYPLFYQRGYKVDGIFQSQEEVTAWLAQHNDVNYQAAKVGPGDIYFKDLRGAPKNEGEFYSEGPDGKIDSYDQVYLGKTIPGFFYGGSINLAYHGFDLNTQFTGVGDMVKYNSMRAAMENTSQAASNLSTSILNSWRPDNKNTSLPRMMIGDPAGNFRNSDHFVESAAYLRLSNIQLGYTLPKSFYELTNGNVRNTRIYLGASNLFTITKYSGLDPENDDYPEPLVLFMGLSVKF